MASMASGSQEIKLKLATYFFQILFQFKQRIPSFSFQEKRKKFESESALDFTVEFYFIYASCITMACIPYLTNYKAEDFVL